MELAPVVLFVYNRPEHTRRTLEALSKNELADQSVLHVFADGPKTNASLADLNKIAEVREVIREQNWCKQLLITEAKKNLGLAQSVIQGVTQIINKYGKVIVLEDDIVTHHSFLKCLNAMLETYANEPSVYGVTGYKFPSNSSIPENTYFLPVMSSWGYGTWVDRWNEINFDGQELLTLVRKRRIGNKLQFGRFDFFQMLKDQVAERIDSWAVRFYVSMRLRDGVFLFPNKSLIHNIGFDGSGVHSGTDASAHITNDLLDFESTIQVVKKPIQIKGSILKKFKVSINGKNVQKKKLKSRIKKVLKQILAPELVQLARRKWVKVNDSSYAYLKNYPRFTRVEVKLLDKSIEVPDAASFIFMYTEIFEVEIYKFFTQNQTPRIIDAGANIGLATIYFKQQFPKAEIIAFEPDPYIMKSLEFNLKQFEFEDIELHQKGLWDKDTQLAFHSEGADGGHIITQEHKNAQQIEVVSLRPFLNQNTDFLKMDIEGAETRVLEDIVGSLNFVERIFIEYHSFTNEVQTLGKIIQILDDAGFRYYVNSPGLTSKQPFVKRNTYNGMDMQLNIYGFKN